MAKQEATINIVLAAKSPIATPYLISHFPDALMMDGVRANVIDLDCMLIVPPVKPGPADQP